MGSEEAVKINKIRSALYKSAKVLGDVQAVDKARRTGSVTPVLKRAERRLVGRMLSKLIP
jgi:hypothetical protein